MDGINSLPRSLLYDRLKRLNKSYEGWFEIFRGLNKNWGASFQPVRETNAVLTNINLQNLMHEKQSNYVEFMSTHASVKSSILSIIRCICSRLQNFHFEKLQSTKSHRISRKSNRHVLMDVTFLFRFHCIAKITNRPRSYTYYLLLAHWNITHNRTNFYGLKIHLTIQYLGVKLQLLL